MNKPPSSSTPDRDGPLRDCPAPAALAAYLSGTTQADRGAIESHLLTCDRCVLVLGQAAASVGHEEVVSPEVVARAAELVPDAPAPLAFFRGPRAVPRSALAAAASLALAIFGYHIGQATGNPASTEVDFIRAVSFETLSEPESLDDLEFILLANAGDQP